MKKVIYWFRRDLRLTDNRSLYEACLVSKFILPVFIFDINILNNFKNKMDRRVTFLWESVVNLKNELNKIGRDIIILYGDPTFEIPEICKKYNIDQVYSNKDYEPYAKKRDFLIKGILQKNKIDFIQFKDHVIFEEREILSLSKDPYKVFTPYKNAWIKKSKPEDFNNYEPNLNCLVTKNNISNSQKILKIEDINFQINRSIFNIGRDAALKNLHSFSINSYDLNRNDINLNLTSKVSIYLRFGTLSIRELFRYALSNTSSGSNIWQSELIWREFYQMILSEFPHVAHTTFKKEAENINWSGSELNFGLWCKGQTGFPIIDAAMRCFEQTGWMHNRLRMVVASFLTKDLLVNYKWGENYFAQNLLDFELASNNGGWQWCASTGCDAQPYFRIFNPESQSKNFDSEGAFIKKYCPELSGFSAKHIHAPHETTYLDQVRANCVIGVNYPNPIVNHNVQRLKFIQMFKETKTE